MTFGGSLERNHSLGGNVAVERKREELWGFEHGHRSHLMWKEIEQGESATKAEERR